MAQVAKRKLSGSTDGRGISVVATATPGTLIHTAVTGVVAGTWDEIWLYAYNTSTAEVAITVEFGGTTLPTDTILYTVPARTGLSLIIDGHILQNGVVVRVFASAASVVGVRGHVNAITA